MPTHNSQLQLIPWLVEHQRSMGLVKAVLKLVATLLTTDDLSSPLLPNFVCPVARLFV